MVSSCATMNQSVLYVAIKILLRKGVCEYGKCWPSYWHICDAVLAVCSLNEHKMKGLPRLTVTVVVFVFVLHEYAV